MSRRFPACKILLGVRVDCAGSHAAQPHCLPKSSPMVRKLQHPAKIPLISRFLSEICAIDIFVLLNPNFMELIDVVLSVKDEKDISRTSYSQENRVKAARSSSRMGTVIV